jgi:hypothetical protein
LGVSATTALISGIGQREKKFKQGQLAEIVRISDHFDRLISLSLNIFPKETWVAVRPDETSRPHETSR